LLFEPPQLSSVFPFFGLNVSRAGDTPSSSFLNPTAGILLAFPVIAILVLLPLLGKKLGKHAPHLAGVVKVLVASGVAAVFTIALVTPPAFRYVADFASLFLVAAMLLWFFLIRSGEHRAIARFIVPAAMFWGIGFGFATGFLGGPVSPYVPDWIAAISRSVRARQGTQDQYGPLELQVRFGEGKKGRIEPLVATGRTGVGDVLFVGWLSENTVQFGLDHVGSQPFVGPGLLLDPKRTYRISVTMGSLYPAQDAIPVLTPGFAGIDVKRRLLVTMDGIPVLSDAREFYDASGAEATVGKNPVGGFVKPEFRGEIISSQRLLKPFF
jgi:hypothetical protein